jgi:asparagine synthase (glutamine-hydrolysing)
MCGISVVAAFRTGDDVREPLLRMHDAIPHRGPDGEGVLLVGEDGVARGSGPARLGVRFRWLKIQDPDESAAQPMASPDASAWLAFNGEIYNHDALRHELRDHGHAFKTRSDAEVVLAAYREWGSDCFRRFNGMWALVIVDLARKTLVLSRDRFGIKPLFHAQRDGRLMVASEAKQIVAGWGGPPAPHPDAVAGYLAGRRSHLGDATFFRGVRAVPPATWAELPLERQGAPELAFRPYWDLSAYACPDPGAAPAFPQACLRLEELLRSSVDLERRAWAPVGCLLSGGLDSSLLASMQAELGGRGGPLRTFSLVLDPVEPGFDESRFMDDVVRHRGLDGQRATLDVGWVRDTLATVAQAQEEPPAGVAVLGQYRVFQRAAEAGTRVVLDGQGSDEIFAGYPRHQDVLLLDRLLGGRLWELALETHGMATEHPGFLWDFPRRALLPRVRQRLGLEAEYAWLPRSTAPRPPAPPRASRDPSRLNRALHADVTGYNLKAVLAITDRNSMAHSVEARVPYLDHRVVELAFGLPDHYKAGAGLRKRILREVARGYVPAGVLARRDRIGFGAPERDWIRGALRDSVRASAESLGGRFPGLIDPRRLQSFVEGFYAGTHDDHRALWRCYALDAWAGAYGVSGG